jgi:hypothetical protein
MICKCYRAEKNFLGKVGVCWGTAERDACSCGGDKSKCNFYPNVREEEKKPVTNYDHLISKSPEELAAFQSGLGGCPPNDRVQNIIGCKAWTTPNGTYEETCRACWLEYLKREGE